MSRAVNHPVISFFSVMYDINRIGHAVVQRVFDKEGVDISVEQWKTLGIIFECQPIAPIEISKQTHKNKGAVARVLTGLEKRDLIKRIHGEKHNTYNVTLTEKGHAVLDVAYDLGFETLENVVSHVDKDELKKALNVLDKTLLSIKKC